VGAQKKDVEAPHQKISRQGSNERGYLSNLGIHTKVNKWGKGELTRRSAKSGAFPRIAVGELRTNKKVANRGKRLVGRAKKQDVGHPGKKGTVPPELRDQPKLACVRKEKIRDGTD